MDRNPNESARKIAEEALNHLSADLKAGRSAALTHLLGAMGRFRRYSWDNALLIAAQRPDASRVATMHAWKDFGRMVKEGEKGILVFTPIDGQQETLHSPAPPEHDFLRQPASRVMYVYDLSQTAGEPVSVFGPRSLSPSGAAEEVKKLIASQALDRAHAEAVAYVVSRGLSIDTQIATVEHIAAYADNKKGLVRTLAVIHETSAKILDELIPQEPTEPRVPAPRQERFLLDAERFARMHQQYRDRLVYSMTAFVRNHAKAEDIAAQAFRAAWTKREGFRGHALPYTL